MNKPLLPLRLGLQKLHLLRVLPEAQNKHLYRANTMHMHRNHVVCNLFLFALQTDIGINELIVNLLFLLI